MVLVDRDGLEAFSVDALAAVRRADADLDDVRAALAQVDVVAGRARPWALLHHVDDLLADLAALVARPAHLATMFTRLDDLAAADRHLARWMHRVGGGRETAGSDLADAIATLPPTAVSALWATLAPADRARLERASSNILGPLDGIPLDVRDRCNRVRLDTSLRRLRAGLRTARPHPASPADAAWDPDPGRTALQVRIRQLEAIRDADLVLAFDPVGDGRAVVAIGDPSDARHVATIVPGIGTTLAAMPRLVHEARTLRDAAAAVDEDVATVAWLGYDTPPGIVGIASGLARSDATKLVVAATHLAADAQQQVLVDHAAGLRVVNPGMHHTVVGHSYGAVLTLRALEPAGTTMPLDADDVVALGAPGAGGDIRTLADLGLPDGVHVWSATSGTDPVPRLPGVLGPSVPELGDRVTILPTDRDNRGHGRYFAPGSAAVAAMAVVVAGRTERAPSRLGDVRPRRRGAADHLGRAR